MPYDIRWGRYRIRVTSADLAKHKDMLVRLMRLAWDQEHSPSS
jgi:hypothetical protein